MRPEPSRPASPTISPRSTVPSKCSMAPRRRSARAARNPPRSASKPRRGARPQRTLGRNLAPDHHRHQLGARETRGVAGADPTPVAEHGDAIAHRSDLLEEVGDEDDREALRREDVASPGRAPAPRPGPGWRWARPGSARAPDVQGPRDGHQLLGGDRQLPQGAVEVHEDAQAIEGDAQLAPGRRASR